LAKASEAVALLGLEHPLVRKLMEEHRSLGPEGRALIGRIPDSGAEGSLLTLWHVQIHGGKGQFQQQILPIALTPQGERSRRFERLVDSLKELESASHSSLTDQRRAELVRNVIPEMIRRELAH